LSIAGTWITPKHDAKVDRLVPQVRERVARVDGERCKHRKNLGAETFIEGSKLVRLELLRPDDHDADAAQCRRKVGVPKPVSAVDQRVGAYADRGQLLLGRQAVWG
jgi:hypothetical protein